MYADLGVVHAVVEESGDSADFTGTAVVSLGVRNRNRSTAKVEALVDLLMPYGLAARRVMPFPLQMLPDSMDGKFGLFAVGQAPVLLDVRKLYFSIYLPFADLTMGRRIIGFGKGVVFSPVDVFSSVQLEDIGFRRRGSDVVMASVPVGDVSGIDLIAGLPIFDHSCSAAFKGFTNVGGWDLSAVGMYRYTDDTLGTQDEITAGITFKGDVEIGLYGEAVCHFLTDESRPFFEGMLGADYSVRNIWFFSAEYLYKEYYWPKTPWGEHNAFGTVRYSFSDLSSVSVALIRDFRNRSTLGTIQFVQNIMQNVDITAYLQGYDTSDGTFLQYALRTEVKF